MRRRMRSKREILTVVLGILSIIGLLYKLRKPNYFFDASMIISGTNYNYFIARALIVINIIAMIFFVWSVWHGNFYQSLKVSYLLMLIYAVMSFAFTVVPNQYKRALANAQIEFNSIILLVTIFLIAIFFGVLCFRESNKIRPIPRFSTFILLVVVGEFVTNGIFILNGQINSSKIYLLYGLICMLPYITIFVFEYFVVEPSLLRSR